MKYKPYGQYKDSGVEWIGDIPHGWEVKKLKYICELRNEKTNDENREYIALEHIESMTGKIIKKENDDIQPEGESICFYKGDVLFCKLRPYLVKCILAQFDGKCTSELLVMKVNELFSEYFLFYVTLSEWFIDVVNSSTYGSKMPRASWNFIGELLIAYPKNKNEQTVIADYLDTETAKIASIIATKQQLIAKLQEKRSSVISHAVTKGLDPNVKMKPSGVAWIGDIPEGWDVKKLKHIVATKITDGPHTTPQILSDGIPFVSAEAAKENRIDLNQIRGYISEEDHREFCKKCKPQKEDIFMVKSGATTGAISFVDIDDEFSIWSPLALVRSKKNKHKQRYIFYSMLSDVFKKQVEISWSFGTQQNIGMGVIENLMIFAPPLPDQLAIANYLDTETAKIDDIIAKTKTSIEKLNEYKTALISACVTGKIDVRGEVQ